MCVCLCLRRCHCRHGCTEITEARHRDNPETGINERLREFEALIEAAPGTMYHKDRGAVSRLSVLDRPTGRVEDVAAGRDSSTRSSNVPAVFRENERSEAC